jgi:hypothetical protein
MRYKLVCDEKRPDLDLPAELEAAVESFFGKRGKEIESEAPIGKGDVLWVDWFGFGAVGFEVSGVTHSVHVSEAGRVAPGNWDGVTVRQTAYLLLDDFDTGPAMASSPKG